MQENSTTLKVYPIKLTSKFYFECVSGHVTMFWARYATLPSW